MCQFRIVIPTKPSNNKITYNSKLLFIGSCFAENIGVNFLNYKFSSIINPFGIIYNPFSIKTSLEFLISQKKFTEEDLFFYNDLWSSFYHHSRYSNIDKEKCLQNINENIVKSSEFLKNTDYLFITFGSAKVYELLKTKSIVSNCHKLPSSKFKNYILSTDIIIEQYKILVDKLLIYNPNLKIIFTISPVRYFNEGFFDNQLNKSTLFIAINEITKMYNNIEYFPAYEIMMDDLRDYRFYKEDMIHPNDIAIKYIWDKIIDTYIEKPTKLIMNEVDNIINAKNHKPYNINSEAHQKFLKTQIEKIQNIQNKHENIDLKNELNHFKSQINLTEK